MRRYIPGACLLVAAAPKPPDKAASGVCLYQQGNERRYTVWVFPASVPPLLLTHIKMFVFLLTNIFICVIIILSGEKHMKSYSSREVIAILKANGWYEVDVTGSHHQFKHPTKKGRTTVKHPDKDIPRKTLDSIERQSGLVFR